VFPSHARPPPLDARATATATATPARPTDPHDRRREDRRRRPERVREDDDVPARRRRDAVARVRPHRGRARADVRATRRHAHRARGPVGLLGGSEVSDVLSRDGGRDGARATTTRKYRGRRRYLIVVGVVVVRIFRPRLFSSPLLSSPFLLAQDGLLIVYDPDEPGREAELEKWHDAFALSATTTRPGEEDDDVRLKPSQCLVLGARRTSGAAPRLMMTGPRTTASAR